MRGQRGYLKDMLENLGRWIQILGAQVGGGAVGCSGWSCQHGWVVSGTDVEKGWGGFPMSVSQFSSTFCLFESRSGWCVCIVKVHGNKAGLWRFRTFFW